MLGALMFDPSEIITPRPARVDFGNLARRFVSPFSGHERATASGTAQPSRGISLKSGASGRLPGLVCAPCRGASCANLSRWLQMPFGVRCQSIDSPMGSTDSSYRSGQRLSDKGRAWLATGLLGFVLGWVVASRSALILGELSDVSNFEGAYAMAAIFYVGPAGGPVAAILAAWMGWRWSGRRKQFL